MTTPLQVEIATLRKTGRQHHIPETLWKLFQNSELTNKELAYWLPRVWNLADYPQDTIPDDAWHTMFAATGYTDNGVTATPPNTITLYRGAPAEYRNRMSWTDDMLAAYYHAVNVPRRKTGMLWVTKAPAEALRMRITHKDFDEYVIDTRGLQIDRARPELLVVAIHRYCEANGLDWQTVLHQPPLHT